MVPPPRIPLAFGHKKLLLHDYGSHACNIPHGKQLTLLWIPRVKDQNKAPGQVKGHINLITA